MSEKPMLGGCCVCLDERGWAENPLVYCDGQSCNVAVHQACYGIIKVPSGPWFCRKCESQERAAKVKCELCPHRDGALKRTDNSGWAHVVCALYIPEVAFGNVSSMEPVVLQKVPSDRFNKTCFLCEEENRSSKATSGACMTCAKQGCKSSFHVTCAQMSGLLCEEASGGNQTKYCGYCKTHLTKGKKTSSVYKNLSCTKVYRLPTTSSSDEIGSPERSIPLLPEPSIMKPGDIRYTKAGKKRSKSLEESLAVELIGSKTISSVDFTIDAVSKAGTNQNKDIQKVQPPTTEQTSNIIPTPVPVISVQPLDVKNDATAISDTKTITENKTSDLIMDTSISVPVATNSANIVGSSVITETRPAGLTLSSLAEAASVLSHSSVAEVVDEPIAPIKDNAQNKIIILPKGVPKKKKEKKTKTKKNARPKSEHSGKLKKRTKTSNSGLEPHRPIPPSMTVNDPVSAEGTVYPRHSVVCLASMGLDRTETYEAHEIGDNNKVFKPDLSVDGVTALERLQEEQRKDGLDFFHKYGASPEVAALMEALQKVRDDNKHMHSAIEQMARRRDQLLLIKTRLLGLQTHNVSGTSTSPSQHGNKVVPHQTQSGPLPAPHSTVSSHPEPVLHQQHLNYPVQQSIPYPQIPNYVPATTK